MIIVCGGLRIDFLISADGRARLNQLGGNAVYASVGARMFAEEVTILARAGENYPQEWLDGLADKGIMSDYVRRVPGWQDMRTFYAYVDEKTRVDHDPETHFARIGQPVPPELEGYRISTLDTQNEDSPLALRGEDAAQKELLGAVAHLAPTALRSQQELVREFRRRGVQQISVDPGEYRMTPQNADTVRNMCGQIDAFLPSELEVELLLNSDDGSSSNCSQTARQAAETFAAWGTPVVVIKRGPQGCLLYERDRRRFTPIPAASARVVDVTGAGDVFSGAFAATLHQTGDPRRAALLGSVAASFAVEGYGALYALDPPREQVEARLQTLAALSGLD